MNTMAVDRIGAFGATIVTTTDAQTGQWMAILCLSATIFSTLTELPAYAISGTLASATFPAGCTIYGGFTNFTLTSGSVRAYKVRNLVANP